MRASCWPLALALLLPACSLAQAGFQPVLVKAEVSPRVVRPGDSVQVAAWFRNDGPAVGPREARVFLHFEDPATGCAKIAWQFDHEPLEPVGLWLPQTVILDGPLAVEVPAKTPAGTYAVHLGLFEVDGGQRLLDVGAGTLRVDPLAAPAAADPGPASLPDAELARRRTALPALRQPHTVRCGAGEFQMEPGTGRWRLRDTASGVIWSSNLLQDRLGRVLLRRGGTVQPRPLDNLRPAGVSEAGAIFEQPLTDLNCAATGLTFRLQVLPAAGPPAGITLQWAVNGASDWQVERVWLLEAGLPCTEADGGRTVAPVRLGLGLPAASGAPTVVSRLTYDDSSMQMLTLEKQGAALLVTWDDVDVRWTVRRAWLDDERLPGRRVLQHSLELSGAARQITLHPLGRGDYVTAARAYRDVAARAGWRVTRPARARVEPAVNAMAGAADFKPFVLSRSLKGTRWNTSGADQVHRGYTFQQVGELATHWRRDLELDQAMVVLAGWIHRGYDNQHPDILPAAPECGGDAELARLSAQVKALGYRFGLHDNYQDMYPDAPSFDPKYLRRNAAGDPLKGGEWAGGQAWQVRPQSQVELARRNLPVVARLFAPTAYFIDTVFAWGLVDSQCPTDRWDRRTDLLLKTQLCNEARSRCGLFGSEEGREWAVPCADYLEGQLGQKWDTPVGEVLPTFLIAYHDCVSTFTHQSTRLGPNASKHLLDHLIYGEMPVYEFGGPRYWERPAAEALPLAVRATVSAAGPGQVDIRYHWRPTATLPTAARAFVHFDSPQASRADGIAFQDDHDLGDCQRWPVGQEATTGPHRLTLPAGLTGDVAVWIGVLDAQQQRLPLSQGGGVDGRYRLGTLHLGATPTFTAAPASAPADRPFARREGWTRDLGVTDRFLKNSYEVLSWVNRLSFGVPLEAHTVRGEVEETRFGSDLHVVVNYGATPVEVAAGPLLGTVRLGQWGFAVWSPTFVAVHALAVDGHEYPSPALYTARALDGQPLASSARVRLFHGCGGPALHLAGRAWQVDREAVVALR